MYLGNVENFVNHFRNAPVGGHTCLTAGERSEPAVVDYKRMNVSVFVPLFRGTSKEFAEGVSGGPTATNGRSQNREVRGKTTGQVQQLVVYPVVVGPPTGTDRKTQL